MSDENVVEIIVKASTDQATQDLQKVASTAQSVGREAESGFERSKVGALGFKVAAHELLGQLGMHGPVMRGIAHEAASMGGSLGTAAITLGAVGIAAVAGYKIYEHFADATKKKREELDKSVTSMESEVEALYRNEGANEDLTKANYRLLEAKRQHLLLDLSRKIEEDTKAIKEQQREVDIASGKIHTFGTAVQRELRLAFSTSVEAFRENEKTRREDGEATLRDTKANLGMSQALYKQFSKDVSYESYAGEKKAQAERERAFTEGMYTWRAKVQAAEKQRQDQEKKNQDQITNIITAAENRRGLASLKGSQKQFAQMQQNDARELAALKKLGATKAQLETASEAQRYAIAAEAAAAREKLEEDHQAAVMNTIGNGIQALGEVFGQGNAVMFLAQKGYAMAETYINTAKGAMAAAASVAGIPIVGPALAVDAADSMWTLGEINMGLIAGTAVAGIATGSYKGGMGAKSGGTYSASPTTGLPTQATNPTGPAAAPQQGITVIVYGSVMTENELGRVVQSAVTKARQDNVGM